MAERAFAVQPDAPEVAAVRVHGRDSFGSSGRVAHATVAAVRLRGGVSFVRPGQGPLATVAALVAACLVAGATATPAEAQGRRRGGAAQRPEASSRDEEARMLFEAGRVAYADGRFEDALDYFQRAHALSGRAALLYNIGSAADKLRRDAVALDAFRGYLEAMPTAENRGEVEARIRVLEQVVGTSTPSPAAESGAGPPQGADRGGVTEGADAEGAGDAVQGATTMRSGEDAAAGAQARVAASLGDAPGAVEPSDGGGGSLLGKWWFWGIVGAVVAAGAVVAVAVSSAGGVGPYTTGDDGRVYMTLGEF
jgi:tetratricopeptide (TPR) repeat protein